jgi:3-methylcrotonyl-CoA carboxylase alpha subunit
MISRLLIANRGEIAVRIARAAREMGIVPLGIYSQADADAYFLAYVHDARCVGPAPAAQSYLDVAAILEAARAMNADALHPGYGFLSENPSFAAAVHDAGAIFVGPPADAMAAMGSKIEAKRRAREAGVPTVPGYDGSDQSPARLREEATRMGFPVLIKASAGGGGRGMRVVSSPRELDDALASAKREAAGAFGDDTLLLERYLENPRHIEFQILADAFGTTLHLGERECSIQRRHQKIVEEAPSVALSAQLRAEMGAAAVRIAASVGYVNAGTAEFMLDASGYYFLEMNARLQVEHPVTEAVHGIDLVQWQLRIASGERLTLRQEDVAPRGWAVEMRITAEDPAHGMLPSAGCIFAWQPPEGPGVRVDSGVAAGSTVGLEYDSMLAKLIVHASDRASAIAKMEVALDDFRIAGIRSNLPLLAWIVRDEAFRSGEIGTAFLAQRLDDSRFARAPVPKDALVLAVAKLVVEDAVPWRAGGIGCPIALAARDERFYASASRTAQRDAWRVSGDVQGLLQVRRHDGAIVATLGDASVRGHAELDACGVLTRVDGREYAFAFAQPPDASVRSSGPAEANGTVTAPMPGRVIRVAVAPGEDVAPHQLLIVLEAMKMEHRIEASLAATVRSVLVGEGQIVAGGTPLVELG